ncbi:hypothetical protein D3C80_1374860 [compost metagenome]
MVDHPAVDLPGVHRLEHGAVSPVETGVGLHRLQPFQRGGLTFLRQQRADDGLEVRTGRRCSPAALPVRAGQVEQRFGQVLLGQLVLVVDEHRGAGGDPHPLAMRRTIGRRHLRHGLRSDRREQAGIVHQHHRRRVLGEEHIGRRRAALLHDLVAHLAVAAIAQGDLDARVLAEAFHPGLGQRGVLGVVDDDAVGAGGRVGGGGADKRGGQDGQFYQCRGMEGHFRGSGKSDGWGSAWVGNRTQ